MKVAELSRQAGLPSDRVRAALTVLGASGQIGYDLAEETYFRRQLPWSAGDAEAYQPQAASRRGHWSRTARSGWTARRPWSGWVTA